MESVWTSLHNCISQACLCMEKAICAELARSVQLLKVLVAGLFDAMRVLKTEPAG